MLKNSAPLFCLLLVVVSTQLSSNAPYITPCSAFRAGRCVACPYNYHQYQSQCYLNVTGCLQYSANASGYLFCTACDSSIAVLTPSGGCALTITEQRNSHIIQNWRIRPIFETWLRITEICVLSRLPSLKPSTISTS